MNRTGIHSFKIIGTVVLFNFLWLTSSAGVAQVVINEFQSINNSTIKDPDNQAYVDWIELYNSSLQSIDLSGWFLSDNATSPTKWAFPNGTNLPAQSHLLIWADKMGSGLHTNFKLSGSGEHIVLSKADGAVQDSLSFIDQLPDVSFGRKGDNGTEWIYFDQPSPGNDNSSSGMLDQLSDPLPSKDRGFYSGAISVRLESAEGATIYYSLDGSDPYPNGSVYSNSPLQVSKTTVLRAQAILDGYFDSRIATHTYFINESSTLPVFSISTDPKNLWDSDIGIYVEGDNYVFRYGNFDENWARGAHGEYWTADGVNQISQNGEIEIAGGLTRTASQKSIRFKSDGDMGPGKLNYEFFASKNINDFEEVVLRNSGNDWGETMLKDGTMQSILANRMDVDFQAFQPAILFLNGEYWGVHNMRERIGPTYVVDNYGISRNDIDFISEGWDPKTGSTDEYLAIVSYCANNDLSIQSNYEYVSSQIDIPAYINYYLAEIFFGNEDWPGSNFKCWKQHGEKGKWRWILFDLDWGYRKVDYNAFEAVVDPNWQYGNTTISRKLLQNQTFLQEFQKRMTYHINTTFSDQRVLHVIDSIKNILKPEMARHITRWHGSHGWRWYTEADGWWNQPWIEDYAEWEDNVQDLRNLMANRRAHVLTQMEAFFGITSRYEINISIQPEGAGFVQIDDYGLSNEKVVWNQLGDNQMQLAAYTSTGYQFSHWEYTSPGGQATQLLDPLLQRSFDHNSKLVAIFIETQQRPPLVINEVMPRNDGFFADPTGAFRDWIELYNPGDQSILINGLYLTDDYTQPTKHKIGARDPIPIQIESGEYKVLWTDEKVELGADHLDFRLASTGEQVGIGAEINGEFVWLDTLMFPALESNTSYGREEDAGAEKVIFTKYPTPGASNRPDLDTTDIPTNIPFVLYQNAPNPFRTTTEIRFDVADKQHLVMDIFDMQGNLVKQFFDTEYEKGSYSVFWDGKNYEGKLMPPGLYIYRLIGPYLWDAWKMILEY